MIRILHKIPRKITVATSGGVDSQVLLDFLSNNHNVDCAFFHHATENSERAYRFLLKHCGKRGYTLRVGYLTDAKPAEYSQEEWWRECRYRFFSGIGGAIATAHTLDDCVETWIWSSLHGCSSIIPYRHLNVIRPLLLTSKAELIDWATRKNVDWIEDQSNADIKYTRNYIRHELMPHALRVNPGLHSMLRKKIVEREKWQENSLTSS